MAEVEVGTRGAQEFRALAARYREAGDKGMTKELQKALQRAARPATAAARASALATLPSGGGKAIRKTRLVKTGVKVIDGTGYVTRRRVRGRTTRKGESLAQRVANAKYTVRSSGGRGGAGVRVTAKSSGGASLHIREIDDGRVRHPLFGNRRHWYLQAVTPGWFTRPMQASAPVVRQELDSAVDELKKQLE